MFSLLLAIVYLAFVSLGLPDSLLGSAWPSIYPALGVPLSWSGGIFMIIALGTVASSLCCDRLCRALGTGRLTAFSVMLTAAALLGFSHSRAYWQLCLWAVPYGLGAGSVDAALNNYAALHYPSRHMNWLHCMWGVGAAAGPILLGAALETGRGWEAGYREIGLIQAGIAALLLLSLPLWKKTECPAAEGSGRLSLPGVLRLPGARAVLLCFFCYCALEQTVCLWAGSYLAAGKGLDEADAARFSSLFFLGITLGRAVSGFVSPRRQDAQMVRLGQGILALGLLLLLLPLGTAGALLGLVVLGLGCAPIYPSLLHATPARFGPENSQALIGAEMACAYVGTALMPPLFGLLAGRFGMGLFPYALLLLLLLMALLHKT